MRYLTPPRRPPRHRSRPRSGPPDDSIDRRHRAPPSAKALVRAVSLAYAMVGPGPRTLPGAGASWLAGRANAEALQVIVAERAIGVEALEQVSRVGELGIRGVKAESPPDFPPVRAGAEGREGLLESGEQADDLPGVVAPGEVEGQRRAPGRAAQP